MSGIDTYYAAVDAYEAYPPLIAKYKDNYLVVVPDFETYTIKESAIFQNTQIQNFLFPEYHL